MNRRESETMLGPTQSQEPDLDGKLGEVLATLRAAEALAKELEARSQAQVDAIKAWLKRYHAVWP